MMLSNSSSLHHLNVSQGLSTAPLCLPCVPQAIQHCTGLSQLPHPHWLPFPVWRARRLPAGRAIGKSVSSCAHYNSTVGASTGSSEAAGKYEGQGRLRFA